MTDRTIIGVTGYAQHGKDTLASRLVETYGFKKFAFADGLRAALLALDPFVPIELIEAAGDTGALQRRIIWGRYTEYLQQVGYEAAKKNGEVRRLLQAMGTEVGRDVMGGDTWVNTLDNLVFATDVERVVITDVRFPNEADWVSNVGGRMVRIIRLNEDGTPFENGVPTDHPSESHIMDLPVDYEVRVKTGDLDKLNAFVDDLARRYLTTTEVSEATPGNMLAETMTS